MSYAELHCLSNFSFLRGASHPGELVARAHELGYRAIAITDECSLAGVVRAHIAAKERDIKLIIGAQFHPVDGPPLVLLAPNRRAYGELSSLISRARLNSPKGEYRLTLRDCRYSVKHCLALWVADPGEEHNDEYARHLQACFPAGLWIAVQRLLRQGEAADYLALHTLAERHQLPMVAAGHVLMHCRERKPLQDVLTAIRLKSPVQELGDRLQANSEQFLRPVSRLQKLLPRALLAESLRIAECCHFELDELRYLYPDEGVPAGKSAGDFLRELTESGARKRWPDGVPETMRQLIERELALIAQLRYEHYFLTVHDIVQFARNRGILCQGRGSAANSAVCYCLYITEVDPSRGQLLFERFISKERNEPPDIDVDFEHERREEVIQYIYRKYGREHAALAATVITYRPRSAVRDVGKALGLDQDLIERLAKSMAWWDKPEQLTLQMQALQLSGLSLQHFFQLVDEIQGFPRHLSQHVGGFVIAREPIATLVPLENAAMDERTIIQWDKSDLEALGLMKIDVLALGMLSALRKALELIGDYRGSPMRLQDIPAEDAATYDMLCRADSIGVFQIESRAQMTMLPRLLPRCFYDLVIQIAIVRPGPIQGGMVHPFLQRRQGLESAHYENADIKKVLERTLGVPIFQEQVIQLAMVAAGFSGGEADELRRAMASWGRNGYLDTFRDKLVSGMTQRGYSEDFAQRLFSQMQGFGAYGFPESHSASFALLAYASAWIKRHHPAAFFCALLNSQPMGFYSPSQLVQDARRHGVEVLPVCVNHSGWDNRLQVRGNTRALRLGLRQVKGLSQGVGERIEAEQQSRPFAGIAELCRRAGLDEHSRDCLIRADALHGFGGHRYQSQWEVSALEAHRPLLVAEPELSDGVALPGPGEVEDVLADYQYTGLSLRRHPLAMLRDQPRFRHCLTAEQLAGAEDGRVIRVAGLVTCRQRPGTASGVLFLTLEDETGNSNIVVWAAVQRRFRQAILTGRLLLVRGKLQRTDNARKNADDIPPVLHVVAQHIEDAGDAFRKLAVASHDFR